MTYPHSAATQQKRPQVCQMKTQWSSHLSLPCNTGQCIGGYLTPCRHGAINHLDGQSYGAMSYSEKVKQLFKKYGRVGVGVHLTIYAATISGCYIAAERNTKLEEFLIRHGLLSSQEVKDDADPETRGWFAKTLTSSGSSLALAFLCTKALLPIRVPLTLAITPPVARLLQGRALQSSSKIR